MDYFLEGIDFISPHDGTNMRLRLTKKITFLLLSAFAFVVGSGSFDFTLGQAVQRVEIPSSPNPVGSGARALGMGGAFIAVADDATAASWNPGGLIQLEMPEVSIVGAFIHRTEDNVFGARPEAGGRQGIDESNFNYFSLSYPFHFSNRNMVVSLNYQHLFDFNREWDFPLRSASPTLNLQRNIHYVQDGELSAVGLAYALQITPRISFGFTLNFWEDWFGESGWEQDTQEQGTGTFAGAPFNYRATTNDRYDFSGFNANLGLLWNMNERFTLGAVFKTPFSADLKHESAFSSSIQFPTFPAANAFNSQRFSEEAELEMPMSYGIGLAFRYSDALTVSADLYRTEWQDFVLKDAKGNETSPITGLDVNTSHIDPTHQIRLGAEYLVIGTNYVVPLRGGLFYDPAPAEGNPDDFYGFSLGSGISFGRFVFDMAYQHRFGNDVGRSILQNLGFSQDMNEHLFYSSIILHY